MAKSKLVKANKKIAEGVVGGYKKIEEGVVGGYKKIEEEAVGGFNKIADKFVDNFLTKEGESVEEARARLAEEQKEREAKSTSKREEREQKKKAAVEAGSRQKPPEWKQEERLVWNNEKEYICSNDFRNDWRNFICAWHVYGVDSGMECVPARSYYGSGWRSRAAYYDTYMEKDGK